MATALDATALAAGLGLSIEYLDQRGVSSANLPQQIAVIAQGSSASTYSTDPWTATSAAAAGARFGYGSPIHHIVKQLKPANGDGVSTIPVTVYPLVDAGSGVAAAGSIAFAGTATKLSTFRLLIGGVLTEAFQVAAGSVTAATVIAAAMAAVNGTIDCPMIATNGTTVLTLTAKWAGESSNSIPIEVIGDLNGVTFTITQPEDGAVNPDVDDALELITNRWESFVVNAMNYDDTTTLGKFFTWGEGRWVPTLMKPSLVFVGCTEADSATVTAITDARATDYVNTLIPDPGGKDMPFNVAARAVARIATMANNNPATGYTGLKLTGIYPGDDMDQWDYAERDAARKKGCSTVEVIDNVVQLADVVTMYHPTGETPAAYAKVVTIVKLMNAAFNYKREFMQPQWAAAPLIPDAQVTTNPNARTPSAARGAADGITDGLGLAAIIADPETVKANTTVVINSQNPDRLDIRVPLFVSGNTEQKAIELYFAFYFGGQA